VLLSIDFKKTYLWLTTYLFEEDFVLPEDFFLFSFSLGSGSKVWRGLFYFRFTF